MSQIVVRFTFALCLALLAWTMPASSQSQDDRLVAKVIVKVDGEVDRIGGSILVHQGDSETVLATAAHTLTLTPSVSELGVDLFVEFLSGDSAKAEVIFIDETRDLAAIRVPTLGWKNWSKSDAKVLRPETLGISPNEPVYSLGFPGRREWFGNRREDRAIGPASAETDGLIEFETSVVETGMSGGALFDEFGLLLGMVLETGAVTKSGLGANAYALPIGNIKTQFDANRLPFSLLERDEIVGNLGQRLLKEQGLDSNDALRKLLIDQKWDFQKLHLYWIADYDPKRFEELLALPLPDGSGSVATQLFRLGSTDFECSNSQTDETKRELSRIVAAGIRLNSKAHDVKDCRSHFRLWIEQMLSNGTDPNLVVPDVRQRRYSLLSIARRERAIDAFEILIEAGAHPNGYIDLSGWEGWKTPFTDAIWSILEDFDGAEQDRLIRSLKNAGVVTFRPVDRHGDRPWKESNNKIGGEGDQVCERATEQSAFKWCEFLQSLPTTVRFKVGIILTEFSAPDGNHTVVLDQTLSINGDTASLLGWIPNKDHARAKPIVVEVPRSGTEWSALMLGSHGGCTPRPNGFESDYCWRRYSAYAGPARVSASSSATTSSLTTTTKSPAALKIREKKIAGISLDTSARKSFSILESGGFERKTPGDPDDYPDQYLTVKFNRPHDRWKGKYETITIVFINDAIEAIQYLTTVDDIPESWDSTFRQTKSSYDLLEVREIPRYRLLTAVVDTGSKRFGVARKSFENREEITLLGRSNLNSPAAQSFWNGKMLDWLGKPSTAADGSCLDDYHAFRGSDAPCKTRRERDQEYLANNAAGQNVNQLASGTQYEILKNGEGRQLKTDDKIAMMISFEQLDSTRGSTGPKLRGATVGKEFIMALNEVLPLMHVGGKARLLVPPDRFTKGEDGKLLVDRLQILEVEVLYLSND